ncbi:hypothetical protein H6G92_32610, partial [Nostoc foliaceum FACHB-393]|nr:hypothetical protein [Nostoc foliaceum FACHB-393]
MSWESEFNSQWQIFLDIVETRIRREIDSSKKLNSAFVNSVVRSEVDKWSISTHYNGAWLGILKRKYPSLGEEFQSVLKDICVSDDRYFRFDLPILKFFKILLIAWVIILLLYLAWSTYKLLVIHSFQFPKNSIEDSSVIEKIIPQKTPGKNTSASPILGKNTSASPIPGKNTSASPIPGKNTSASPIPGKNTSASPIPGKNTSASPIPGKNTSASPIPGKNTSASPIPGKNTSASPIPGKNTSASPIPGK